MRRTTRAGTSVGLLVLALAAAACSGGSDAGGGTGSGSGRTLNVWTIEDVKDRVTAQQKLVQRFTAKTGIKVNLTPVAEDQFDQVITSAAAAGKAPDVVAALGLSGVRTLSGNGLLNSDLAGKVVSDLGEGTFAKSSLALTRDGDKQLAVPADGWAQLLVYRKDLFDKAGLPAPTSYDAITKAASTLNRGGMAGITLATDPGAVFTQQTFEYFAQANGCELVGADKKVTLDSPNCVRAFDFYSTLAKQYSVKGNQTDDSTRATYFAGKAAMVVWSSFLLDEMAGLRKDALPTCPECRSDPAYLAKNSGIVSAVSGPDGKPSQYGDVGSFMPTTDAPKDEATKFIEFMLSDGYSDWLAIAPEGKVPVRQGTKPGDTSYLTTWKGLKAGVDTKAPLAQFYKPEVLEQVQHSPETFNRWGLTEGQGDLVGAILGELPVPKALSREIAGKQDAAGTAKAAQKAVEDIQKGLN